MVIDENNEVAVKRFKDVDTILTFFNADRKWTGCNQ